MVSETNVNLQVEDMISCGIILVNSKDEILACHCTGKKFTERSYDIPKGVQENNEDAITCLSRELKEETNLSLSEVEDLQDLGIFAYITRKDLHLFYGKLRDETKELKCSSTFFYEDKEYPEVNGYRWVSRNELAWFFGSLQDPIKQALERVRNAN